MKQQVIWVFTHDSFWLGEDGPTHEPIEHVASLRLIPNLLVVRPADGVETAGAWGVALERRDGPTLIALTRQTLPPLERPADWTPAWLRRAGCAARNAHGRCAHADRDRLRVSLAIAAAERLEAAGRAARVVSMMAPQRFLEQDQAWRDHVLPPGGRRVSLEAGATGGWYELIGERGLAIGMDRFGESAPGARLAEHFGFTPEQVASRILAWAAR